MLFLRRKIWVVLLFSLISIGQGFALSYTFNLSTRNVASVSESSGPVPAHLLVCGHDFKKILRENPKPHQKNPEELLSLRTDPFIPSFLQLPEPLIESLSFEDIFLLLIQNQSFPPDRPPRLS